MLDYSGCVLYNWALLDEKGPVSTDNARMLRRFTGETRRWRGPRCAARRRGGERRAPPRHRAVVASTAWRATDTETVDAVRRFFKTHLVIEAAAAPAVAALNEGADVTSRIVSQDSIQDCHEVLSKIEDCFGHVVRDCLPLMFERHGQHGALCDYYFFYARLRPFINGLDAVIFEGRV